MKLDWRVDIVCKAILESFNIKSLIDFGCARGEYVKGFLDQGIDAWGIEGSPCCLQETLLPQDRLIIADLRLPLNIVKTVDLVMCFEVAEHIEDEHAHTFCQNLCLCSKQILLTAAPPGQGGHYHVNCRPKDYWVSKMQEFGYLHDQDVVTKVIDNFSHKHRREIVVYCRNLMYFGTVCHV
jgi:hypothetical protein